ncbi:MAG: hypothetical protein WAO41_02960 [Candidatus Nanopelagicales bacterium]|jgi:predicted ribosome-associated RNA-binding protein Tma20
MKEKMKLYKVTFSMLKSNLDRLFIIAIDKEQAIKKAKDFTEAEIYDIVDCVFICNRDEIIPTVEPIQEFKNQ